MTVDVARGILYMPFGAPNNDRVGVDRPGNNLFDSSLVAVNADTGKLLWYFQVVHHDVWDLDLETPPSTVRRKHDGKVIPAVATVNKKWADVPAKPGHWQGRSTVSRRGRCRKVTYPASTHLAHPARSRCCPSRLSQNTLNPRQPLQRHA